MSLAPDDWREYQWRAVSGSGTGSIGEQYDRHWRITVRVFPEAAPSITFASTGAVLDLSAWPDSVPFVLEPRGMSFGAVQFVDVDIILEAVMRS